MALIAAEEGYSESVFETLSDLRSDRVHEDLRMLRMSGDAGLKIRQQCE